MSRPHDLAEDLVTVEEFYRLVPDGRKADLIDGVIYMASPDSLRANELTILLCWLMKGYVETRGLGGKVLSSRFAFRLGDLRAPEPDVAYVRPERVHLLEHGGMRGGPDVAVEIVSRESRNRDYGEKRQLYQDAEVPEYWIIDPVQQRVEFLLLGSGRYELAALEDNRRFRSRAIPGLWLDVDWLLADPLPAATRCLEQILADQPA